MNAPFETFGATPHAAQDVAHVDVLIVGAGISGIDAAHHLKEGHPGRSFLMLERQTSFGGTWRTHRYPGIRSDSDLHTFGFKWKPWTGPTLATAEEILAYLDEAIEEEGLAPRIRYGHEVLRADWDGEAALWTLDVLRLEDDARLTFTCNFLWMCQGYYRHQKGYTPQWEGMAEFRGDIVHPQTWPEDLETEGKRIVVIGSGATAATLVPAVAGKCAHVTMLQRSPTWFYPRPTRDEFAEVLKGLDLPQAQYHDIMRRKILKDGATTIRRSFEEPDALAQALLAGVRAHLGEDFDLERHFKPDYRPWRQRLAVVPDGDMFKAMRRGEASVVTDGIARFEEGGVRLTSGDLLEADIVVTATGFDLCAMGDIAMSVDGRMLDLSKTWTHRGILFSDVPNLAWTFGYLRTSWTMRANLVSEFVCRLLARMDADGARTVTPRLRDEDRQMPPQPFITEENFNAGYIMRGIGIMPMQGNKLPWLMTQDYQIDKDEIPEADLDDGTLVYA
ncbi:MAG: NAD(P)/FAD-dependent oxidoreductase [Pseudomonadota bacterium]|nr:NAD(P)/FAD-dependent oxidoreductase [Pseudomonadota bacterium]